jgi:hypothetical protein
MIEHVNLGTVQRTESAMKDIGFKLGLGLLFGYKAPSSALNPASFCSLAPSKRVASLPALHSTESPMLDLICYMLKCKQCLLISTA